LQYADHSSHIIPCGFVDTFAWYLHIPETCNGYTLKGSNEESHYAECGGEPDEDPTYKAYGLAGCNTEILERDGDLG
jgi:hypothetical protein